MPRFNDIIFLIVSRYKASCSWWGFQTSSDDHQNRKLDSFTYKNQGTLVAKFDLFSWETCGFTLEGLHAKPSHRSRSFGIEVSQDRQVISTF